MSTLNIPELLALGAEHALTAEEIDAILAEERDE